MYIFHLHVNFQYISWSLWYIYKIDIYRRVINPCVGTPIQYTLPSLFVLWGSASGQVYISWSLWYMYQVYISWPLWYMYQVYILWSLWYMYQVYISWSLWYMSQTDIYRKVLHPRGISIKYTLPTSLCSFRFRSGTSGSQRTRYIYDDHFDTCAKLTFIVEYNIHVLVLLYSTRDRLFFVLLGSAPGLPAVSALCLLMAALFHMLL